MHAFDYGKIAGGKIVVRRAGETREFVTLDNVTRTLDPNDLLIADSDKPLAIAGVMGGLNSEVSDSTTTILLESAYFEPMTVARTARRLGLRSEASYRFERGIDRAGQVGALIRAAELIRKIARGREASPIADFEPRKAEPREIALDLGAMESLLGASIPPGVARSRLKSLGAQVSTRAKGILAVVPPSFRSDLVEQADLIEEVARLGGLEEIPALLPPRVSALAPVNREREFIKGTREVMLGCGLTEAATIAFIAPADNARFSGIQTAARPVKVTNPLSAELSELRVSLMPGLVDLAPLQLESRGAQFSRIRDGQGLPHERRHRDRAPSSRRRQLRTLRDLRDRRSERRGRILYDEGNPRDLLRRDRNLAARRVQGDRAGRCAVPASRAQRYRRRSTTRRSA